ncbi:LysR family transcriptional regulator [Salipiger thiooxidans]|uniref:LysR family transcriptional regulator n=1 Tax=Salipiger thiooxidans TaxID=282683 RepID=UPI001CD63AE9|nr:LysR family transcriptional regulator [Salipiger thiooxidans]MCA0850616.1 LysR family transcriptional regulator [Salipiger thiooxidans]
MITFKQLEAIYWIANLGSFAAAADKLCTTQSAVSKRVQELEAQFQIEIFDRSRRTARLTDKGNEILSFAKKLLSDRDQMIERASSKEVMFRRLRLGVTELTAMTWLPKLVSVIRSEFPRVSIEPEVELSATLFERLIEDSIDLIIVPDVFDDSRCVRLPIAPVENAWMVAPSLYPGDIPLRQEQMADFTLLVQGNRSGTGIIYNRWLEEQDFHSNRTMQCESLVAQIGFTVSGLGISYLPVPVTQPLIDAGHLRRLPTEDRLPHVKYSVLYKSDRTSEFRRHIADLAKKNCYYSSFFSPKQ